MRFICLCLFSFFVFKSYSQIDTTIKSSWYARASPVSIYGGSGLMRDRISNNIEFGRSIGVLDFGISYGRVNLRPDSTGFLEGKVTLDAGQIGLFSNELTIGGGYVFNSKTPLLLEISSTILVQVNRNWGVGLIVGNYDISGETYSTNKNFYGIYLRYGLLRSEGGYLMNRKFRIKHHIK